jgi:transcriptional regulator with XRE-family HTH domain
MSAHPFPPGVQPPRFGLLLRDWRRARRFSQLQLALEAGISSRHLSYIETGRSRPSREMVALLATVLDVPLRERNSLSLAAGYAPEYRESDLSTTDMEGVRRAITLILTHHEPYPAFVVNRYWDVVMANDAARRFFGRLRGTAPGAVNVMRDIFAPDRLRPRVLNWEEVAGDLIRLLHDEAAAAPGDERVRTLLEEMLSYPGVPGRWRLRDPTAPPSPLLTAAYDLEGRTLRFFSTIATFGTPHDVTLDELRIECAFPADEETDRFCRAGA